VGEALVRGAYIHQGGLSFHPVGFRTHAEGHHVHDTHEVLVIEPGDEHYLIGDPEHPIINLWFHCADERHSAQQTAG
jgi:hypothetical protein